MSARTEVVLTARVMPVARNGDAGDVGRFVRYIQYRDTHADSREARDVDGLVAYIHHRDPSSPRGRMFDAEAPAGDEQRRALVDVIGRSNAELRLRARPSSTSMRAAYRFIISPEDARGINLQRLTRAAMARLEADAGGKLPSWIAGEHRNTRHPHVHVIMAARRETAPGEFRTLVITRDRLAAMKTALHEEMVLQREAHRRLQRVAVRAEDKHERALTQPLSRLPEPPAISAQSRVNTAAMLAWSGLGPRPSRGFSPTTRVAVIAGLLARYNREQAERLARRRRRAEDEGEDRGRSRRR